MLGFIVFTILASTLTVFLAIIINRKVALRLNRASFLQAWKGWQLSSLIRMAGLLIISSFLVWFLKTAVIDTKIFLALLFLTFTVLMLGFFLDIIFSLQRLKPQKVEVSGSHEIEKRGLQ